MANEEMIMDVNDVAVEDNCVVNVDACVEDSNDHKFLKGVAVGTVITVAVVGAIKGGKWLWNKGKDAIEAHKAKKAAKEEAEMIMDAEEVSD